MQRREFLKNCAASWTAGMVLSNPAMQMRVKKKRPNIIVFMSDDTGFECHSCYGSTSYQTPRIDELAADGIRFTHGYSQPLCTPSRVQIMTGIYNNRNYVKFGMLDPKQTTFGHILKDAGYATAVTGKWQLYSGGDGTDPVSAGFDEYCLWSFDARGERYADPTYMKNDVLYENQIGKYGPDIYSDFAIDFIERKKDGPFFVYYPMALTHGPFEPTPDSPEWGQTINDKKFFADMVAYMDKIVGKIYDKLVELDLAENTLIIFTGDNGTPTGITSEILGGITIDGGKASSTDAGTHVAMIGHWKGTGVKGAVSDDLIDFSDILPTVIDAAGAKLPDGLVLDGRSFLPQILGQNAKSREWIYCFYHARQKSDKWPEQIFARDQRWKLYDTGDHERSGNLYDVPNDFAEENPVPLGDPEADAARTKLQAVLDSHERP